MSIIDSRKYAGHMVSVDSYEIIKDANGLPSLIDCWCYIDGQECILNGQYEHKSIPFDLLVKFNEDAVHWENIDEYFKEETNTDICADLEQIINKKEGRTYKIPKPDFPSLDMFTEIFKK